MQDGSGSFSSSELPFPTKVDEELAGHEPPQTPIQIQLQRLSQEHHSGATADVLDDAFHDAVSPVGEHAGGLVVDEHEHFRITNSIAAIDPHSPSIGHSYSKRSHDQVDLSLAEDGEAAKRPRTEEELQREALRLGLFNDDDASTAVSVAAVAAEKKLNNEQWHAMFERMIAYKAKHGDCLVPKRYADDPKLGTWVETQRVQYKRLDREVDDISGVETVAPNKRLNLDRLEKLESIGFVWSAKNTRRGKAGTQKLPPQADSKGRFGDAPWEQMYERLLKFKEMHGHAMVPRKYEEDPRLASWVETQRALWNSDCRTTSNNNNNAATADGSGMSSVGEPHASASPGVGGSVSDSAVLPIQAIMPADDPAIVTAGKPPGGWVDGLNEKSNHSVEEEQHFGAHGGATAEDAAELTAAIGEEGAGDIMDDEVVHQEETAGVATASSEAVDNSTRAREGEDQFIDKVQAAVPLPPTRLSQYRKEKLDAIGFVWSLRSKRVEDNWDQMFRQLVQYKEKHGDCLVPSRYEPNQKLGKWVETQRYEFTKLQRAANGVVTEEPEGPTAAGKPRSAYLRLTNERLRRLNSIGFEWKVKHKMKRFYDRQWDQMFGRLLKFKEENGHCMVPKRYLADQKLATWVHTQRIQYRKMLAGRNSDTASISDDGPVAEEIPPTKPEEEMHYRLTEDRRRRLEGIGFCWSARDGDKSTELGKMVRNSYDDQWDSMFGRLKEFKDKNGHCLVPKRFKEDLKLGTWVDTQRVQFKKMKKKLAAQGLGCESAVVATDDSGSDVPTVAFEKPLVGRLTDDRIKRLTDLGFVWSLRDDWQQHYEELKDFKERHGHCNVPARYAENRKLGIFVSAQRQQYKMMQAEGTPDEEPKTRKPAPLTQERIGLLNKLGFAWSLRSRDAMAEYWNQRLGELAKYCADHGHCNVPSRYPPNPELGTWVGTQRTHYRLFMKAKESGDPTFGASTMTEERIEQLESLGFEWTRSGRSKAGSISIEKAVEELVDSEELRRAGTMKRTLDDETDEILRQAIEQEEI